MANGENFQPADVDTSHGATAGIRGLSPRLEDAVTENQIDRLEAITGGDEEEPEAPSEELQRQFDALDASTEEELDALEVNFAQDDERGNSRDSSGRIIDDLATEEIAKDTEVGPAVDARGAESVEPGGRDTSETLRRHRPAPQGGDPDAIVEGNLDEPLDEGLQ